MSRNGVLMAGMVPVLLFSTGCKGQSPMGLLSMLLGAATRMLAPASGVTPLGTGNGVALNPGPTSPLQSPTTASLVPGQPGSTTAPGPSSVPSTTPVGATGGSGPDNVKSALAQGMATLGGGHANDGRLTFTQYGGPTDGTPDANTKAGLGNRGNQLRATSLALSPNLIEQYGLSGGEAIYLKSGGKTIFLGTYDDTTGNRSKNNVIDIYDPQDRLGKDNFLATIPAGQWELVIGQASA